MAALRPLLLLGLLLAASPGLGRWPPAPQSPLEQVAAPEGLGLAQLAGSWFLVGMVSPCSALAEQSHRLEATAVTVSVPDEQSLVISTFRRLDGTCWEIWQRYLPAQAHGGFLLKGHGYGGTVHMLVGETDHSSYAILYYQRGRSISLKLYGRSSRVSDAIADRFEQRARAVGLSQDLIYYFPTYGFCTTTDEFHILDESKP
ncbi:complement component C8 gamma chain isoform X2 [Colius striatus]|uniref:complement component C8 gamma chain isoform X2 n=1 Tax=Colius striatus TaxID=57412 RepID=UPI002B1D93E2|nr:complement component C8 gamma chain isoform X2 [Colius striatus]